MNYLKKLLSRGITQAFLAKVIGSRGASIGRWLKGERSIPDPTERLLWVASEFPEVYDALVERYINKPEGAR